MAPCSPEVACWDRLDDSRPAVYVDSFTTEMVASELKKQSSAGCLLCSLEESLEGDWDDA